MNLRGCLFQSRLLAISVFVSVSIANAVNIPKDLGRFGYFEWGNCDFFGSDLVTLSDLDTKDQCGNECYNNAECTHFTWTGHNGNDCLLKHFEHPPLSPTDDFNNFQCGWISARQSQPEIEYLQWRDDIDGVKWTTACQFYGPEGSLLKNIPDKSDRTANLCRADCVALSQCTHFNWVAGRKCELKHFNVSVEAYNFDGTICGSANRPSATPKSTTPGAETSQFSNSTNQWISSTTEPSLGSGENGSNVELADAVKYIIAAFALVLLFVACLVGLLGRAIQLNKKRNRSVRLVRERLLGSGDPDRINPDISVEDQVDLLPYDLKWEFPRNRIIIGKQLGAGQFGTVCQAKQIGTLDNLKDITPRTVAIKMIKSTLNLSALECLVSELKILIHLGPHLNVVNLLGACTKEIIRGELLVIEEFCPYGNIRDYLIANRDSFTNELNVENAFIGTGSSQSHLNSSQPHELQEDNNGRYKAIPEARENLVMDELNPTLSTFKPSNEVPIKGSKNFSALFRKSVQDMSNQVVLLNGYGYMMPSDEDNELEGEGMMPTNCGVPRIGIQDLIYWSFQITRGMNHLANKKVIHGDLAARNVLLSEGNIVKIADFGLSRQTKYNDGTYLKTGREALPVKWMALESLTDRIFTAQSDVWSFGVLLWELFSLGKMPYPDVTDVLKDLIDFLQRGGRLEKPSLMPDLMSDIMAQCWENDPKRRPTFSDLERELGKMLGEELQSHYFRINNGFTC